MNKYYFEAETYYYATVKVRGTVNGLVLAKDIGEAKLLIRENVHIDYDYHEGDDGVFLIHNYLEDEEEYIDTFDHNTNNPTMLELVDCSDEVCIEKNFIKIDEIGILLQNV